MHYINIHCDTLVGPYVGYLMVGGSLRAEAYVGGGERVRQDVFLVRRNPP